MHFEELSKGDSLLHRLDPRIKIIIALFFSIIVAISQTPYVLLWSFIFATILLISTKLKIQKIFYRLLLVNGFIFILWFILPFTYPGRTLFTICSFNASREGINYTMLITLKSNTILMVCIALLSTTPIFTLIHALRHLYLPDKLTHLFFFNFRYIHVIHQEYDRLKKAVKIRCFRPKTDLHTYKTYAYLIGILLLRSYDRSKRIYKAMICRGFKGKYFVLDHFKLKKSDIFIGSIMGAYILGLIFLEWKITIF